MVNRIVKAVEALRGKPAKNNPYIAATVRPSDVGGYGANRRLTYTQFIQLCTKWTAIAVDRNANAVADTPLRVMRMGKGDYTGAWSRRRLNRYGRVKALGMCDSIARKALGDSEELEEITDPMHPLVRLLARPNHWQSGFDLVYDTVVFLDLTGNAYAAHVPGPNSPVYELWNLPSQWTRPIPDRATFLAGYIYGRGQEVETTFPTEDITHVKFANPTDPYLGRGCVAGYVGDAQLSLAFTDVNLAMLDNGAAPSLVFKAPNSNARQREEIEEKIRQRWTGVRNAFSAIVTGGDIEVVPNAARGFTEMPFMLSDSAVADLIANSHGMSPALLRMDSAALATAQAALPHWQTMAIKPRCTRIAEAWNRTFVEKFRQALGDESLCVVFDDPVTKDVNSEVVRLTQLHTANVLTTNEVRGALGYEQLPGHDELREPVDTFGGGFGGPFVGNNDEPKDRADGATEGTDEEDDDEPVTAEKRRKSLADAWFDRHDKHCCGETRPRVKKIGERYIQLTERQLERVFSDYFEGASGMIVEGIDGTGLATVELSRLTDYNARARQLSDPIFRDLWLNGYNGGAGEANERKPGVLEMLTTINDAAAAWLEGYGTSLYTQISVSVDDKVRGAIARVMMDGGGIPEMRNAVEAVMSNASTYAAERIARTESARAFGVARREAWKASGIVVGEEWMLSGNPCAACVELHTRRRIVRSGQPFARVGETFGGFTVGFADVYGDPLHPNCACGTAAIFDDDPAAVGLRAGAPVGELATVG
jgi:HK97 family phage portal protein